MTIHQDNFSAILLTYFELVNKARLVANEKVIALMWPEPHR